MWEACGGRARRCAHGVEVGMPNPTYGSIVSSRRKQDNDEELLVHVRGMFVGRVESPTANVILNLDRRDTGRRSNSEAKGCRAPIGQI